MYNYIMISNDMIYNIIQIGICINIKHTQLIYYYKSMIIISIIHPLFCECYPVFGRM